MSRPNSFITFDAFSWKFFTVDYWSFNPKAKTGNCLNTLLHAWLVQFALLCYGPCRLVMSRFPVPDRRPTDTYFKRTETDRPTPILKRPKPTENRIITDRAITSAVLSYAMHICEIMYVRQSISKS